MISQGFQDIVIEPIKKQNDTATKYKLYVFGDPASANLWTTPGVYDTPEQAVETFKPKLRSELKQRILRTLLDGRDIAFSLQKAFDLSDI
ncbi:hypothetical protein [Granulicella sibirica]|uniref:Uncharacterized protein n=1 Tax=Granulicella sibirica TaxID=2479048 RepID=A0A4Q0T6V7_9BACT|nr:hypothetical protein [Granulicella sibirica]RXH57848.1 hypothetical protein GRAN_1158 [Granulicella sibirica]